MNVIKLCYDAMNDTNYRKKRSRNTCHRYEETKEGSILAGFKNKMVHMIDHVE